MDEDEHAGVEDAVFVGVRWERCVDGLELEVQSGSKQRCKLLTVSDPSCAESHGLRQGRDGERDECPNEVEEGERDDRAGKEEEDLHSLGLLQSKTGVHLGIGVRVCHTGSIVSGLAMRSAR